MDFNSFDDDRAAVVQRAEAEGVLRILNPGIDLETSRKAIDLARQTPPVYAAVGFHPNELQSWDAGWLEQLALLARSEKVVAIGEIGLDYYWEKTERDLQWRIFEDQLTLAGELGLPVVVHSRDKPGENPSAMADVLCALERWRAGLKEKNPQLYRCPGVLHSFSGSLQEAESAIRNGFFIGVSGPVTFKNAEALKTVVKTVPIGQILSETDAPFLTPHPHRGKRNEPGFVRFVTAEIARLRDEAFDQVSEIIYGNAKRLFHW